MELDVSVMSSKLGNAPPLSCWFKKPVEHTIVNGIWLITLHAMPPAVCAGRKWNSLGEWREKPLQRNFRAPHYTLPLGTFTPFISHLMNCLHFSAFQAPHKFAPVLVSLFALGKKTTKKKCKEDSWRAWKCVVNALKDCDLFVLLKWTLE